MQIYLFNFAKTSALSDHVPDCLQKIAKTQNKVIRAIFHKLNYDRKAKAHARVTPLYKELSILKLCGLCYYNLAIPGHNYFHNNTLPKIASYQFTRNLGNNLFRLGTIDLNEFYAKKTFAISAYVNYLPTEIYNNEKTRWVFSLSEEQVNFKGIGKFQRELFVNVQFYLQFYLVKFYLATNTNHEFEWKSNSSTVANTLLGLTIQQYRALILPFYLPAEVEVAKS